MNTELMPAEFKCSVCMDGILSSKGCGTNCVRIKYLTKLRDERKNNCNSRDE